MKLYLNVFLFDSIMIKVKLGDREIGNSFIIFRHEKNCMSKKDSDILICLYL